MSTNQWKLIKFIACAIATFGLGWLFSIEKWEVHHAGFFALFVGIWVIFFVVCSKTILTLMGMSDEDIHRVVELVMYFVRTRRNAGSATNNEVFMYVKDKLNESNE